MTGSPPRSIDDVLELARDRSARWSPQDALAQVENALAFARRYPCRILVLCPDAAPAADVTPPDLPALLPLLAGEIPPGIDDYFQACSRLADLLAEQGEETVFLAPDRPVAWRTALLHQLVQRQRIDPRGAGFWRNPGAAAEDAADARATRAALHALAAALGF